MSLAMIGLDTTKSVFQLHGVDAGGKVQLKRKLQRSELIPFFERQPRCAVVMEACAATHHWARVLSGLGHEVKLMAPEGRWCMDTPPIEQNQSRGACGA